MTDELILELPCPIGGTLWRVCITPTTAHFRGHIYVKPVTLNKNNFWRIVIEKEYGKTVFLSRAEAETVAERMREEQEED